MSHMLINSITVPYKENQTVLSAALEAGVELPSLCRANPNPCNEKCGICIAENLDNNKFLFTCSTLASEGLNISTESEAASKMRAKNVERMFSSGAHNCFSASLPEEKVAAGHMDARNLPWHEYACPSKGACLLQSLVTKNKVPVKDTPLSFKTPVVDDRSPFIVRDYSRCVRCGRCIDVCKKVGQEAISFQPYEKTWHPSVDFDKCTQCGQCLEVCPVGALFDKKAIEKDLKKVEKVQTTCPYCGTGCQLQLHVKDKKIVKVTADENVVPNKGRLCVKGRFGFDFIYSENRLTTPLIKENGEFREASWDEALDLVASKFMQIKEESGPDAIAGLSCARTVNEDSYNMQKLFRSVIGTNNIDHCART